MAGRGRGVLRRPQDEKLSEPLRRPITKVTLRTSSEDISIDERLKRLQLSDNADSRTPPSVAVVSQNVKDQVLSETDLKATAQAVVQFGVKGGQQASIAAQLVQDLGQFGFHDSKFRVEFLYILQTYFEAGDFTDLPKYLGYLTLLCEMYHHMGRDGQNPLSFLHSFILEQLMKLLSNGSDQEISTFVQLVLRLSKDITENEYNNVLLSVRKCIVSSRTSEKSRSSLLQLFEIYLRDWGTLSKDVNELYHSYQ